MCGRRRSIKWVGSMSFCTVYIQYMLNVTCTFWYYQVGMETLANAVVDTS
jgi:hypothetical protein